MAREKKVFARYVSAAAEREVQAIRRGTFLYRSRDLRKEIQKPLVFGGVLFHISFAAERNMAAGGKETKIVGPLRPKVTRARGRGTLPVGDMEEKRTGRRGRRPLQRVRRKCAGIWRCVDAGCRGRRPLRKRERGRQQI